MEKIFRECIRKAFAERMQRSDNFRKTKLPVEYSGDLASSQFYQWTGEGRVIVIALVLARSSASTGLRLFWQTGYGDQIDVLAAHRCDIDVKEPTTVDALASALRLHSVALLDGASVIGRKSDGWDIDMFPPRERIRPLMTVPGVLEEIRAIDPAAMDRWEGNSAWDNWATVSVHGGPLTVDDAAHACRRPIDTTREMLEELFLPVSDRLMSGQVVEQNS